MNIAPVDKAIRDTMAEVSLLERALQKIKEKPGQDEHILNALGISGKWAKEEEYVTTAASGKEPLPQNFQSTETENITENSEDIFVQTESIDYDDLDEFSQVSLSRDFNETEESVTTTEDGTETEYIIDITDDEYSGHTDCTADVPYEIEINENGPNVFEIDTDGEEAITSNPEKLQEDDNVCGICGTNDTFIYVDDFYENRKPDNEICTMDMEGNEHEHSASDFSIKDEGFRMVYPVIQNPSTIDIHFEPPQQIDIEDFDECCLAYTNMEDHEEREDQETILAGEKQSEQDPVSISRAFLEEYDNMTATVDLAHYTGLPSPGKISPHIITGERILELVFSDLQDYCQFLYFLGEIEKRKWYHLFTKKGKSIFITVTNTIQGSKVEYVFEFSGCRLLEISDSAYYPEHNYQGTEDNRAHPFIARFRYRKIILK